MFYTETPALVSEVPGCVAGREGGRASGALMWKAFSVWTNNTGG